MFSGIIFKIQKILEQGLLVGIYIKNWIICLYCILENGILYNVKFVILVYVFFFFMKGFCIKYNNLKDLVFWE